jgi:streptogramin lyase
MMAGAAAIALAAAAPLDATAAPTVRTFFLGTTLTRPTRITAGRDGNLWFTERATSKIGRITPAGVVTEFPTATPSAEPFGITSGPNGFLFFTERNVDKIGRSTLAGGVDDTIATVGDEPEDIAAGDDGVLWFTQRGSNQIGRREVFLTTPPSNVNFTVGDQPTGITAGPSTSVWFTEFGADRIGRIYGGVVEDFPVPTGASGPTTSGPTGIAAGPDDNVWFTEMNAAKIGRITFDGTVTEYDLPNNTGQPESIVAGPDGDLWFTEKTDGQIGRITPSGTIDEFSAGGNQPSGITAGPDGNIWFTLDSGNAIGRITTEAEPLRYTDPSRILVPDPDGPQIGPANRYPATIEASGLTGTVTDVRVRLNGVHHANVDDIEALLVGPQNQTALLLADAAGGADQDVATGETITLDDAGRDSPTQFVSGIFKPIVPAGASTDFEPPAPPAPYGGTLSVFDGTNPNGTWKLYLRDDDGATGSGALTGGWSLDIKTTAPTVQLPDTQVEVPGPEQVVTVPGPTTTVTGPATTVTGPATTVTVPRPADTRAPTLRLGSLAVRMPQATFRRGLKVAVTPSEPVTLDVTLSVKPKKATLAAAGDLLLFERSFSATRATTLAVKPSARHLGRPKKPFRATLRIVATDAGANRAVVTKAITVDPDKKRRR